MKAKTTTAIFLAILMFFSIGANSAKSYGGLFDIITYKAYAETDEEDGDSEVTDESDESGESGGEESSETELQIIQVMAKGKNANTGELYDMEKFVAGKSTVIRMVFGGETEILQDGSMVLNITKDGEELAQLLPINSGMDSAATFAPRDLADVNKWEAGEYEFAFVKDDETVVTRTITFSEAKKIKVLAVPVLANYGGQIVGCEGEWKTGIQMTRDTYPIADDGVELVLGEELDLSDSMYDLTTDEGMFEAWKAVANLQPRSNDYELILGYVRNRQGSDGSTQGYTYGLPANIITESDGDMQPTVAHEIAHCYKVGDEYDGGSINQNVNPAPDGMEGRDYDDREQMIRSDKQAVERAGTHSGSLVGPEQVPFNTTTMQPLSDVGSWMGSGSPNSEDYWVTSDIWNQLFNAFVNNDITATPYAE